MGEWKDQDQTPEAERLAYWREHFPSGYFWCLHCETARNVELHRQQRHWAKVARNECWCGTLMTMDGWDWDLLREGNPALPQVPEHGRVYENAMYPKE